MKQIVYVILAVASIMLSSPVISMNNNDETLEETVYQLLCQETIKKQDTKKNDNQKRLFKYHSQREARIKETLKIVERETRLKQLHTYRLTTLVNYYAGQKSFFQPTLDNILKLSPEELQNYISNKVSPQIYEAFSEQTKNAFVNQTPIKNDLKKIMASCVIAFKDLNSDVFEDTFEKKVYEYMYQEPWVKTPELPKNILTSSVVETNSKGKTLLTILAEPLKLESTDIITEPTDSLSPRFNWEHKELIEDRKNQNNEQEKDGFEIIGDNKKPYDCYYNDNEIYIGNPYILDLD